MSNSENEITEIDRQIAEAIADRFGGEPDYEHSANTRREWESVALYMRVHGLNGAAAWTLVKIDDHARYATKYGLLTPLVAGHLAECRRLAWANGDEREIGEALMASFSAIHEERMKPENIERAREIWEAEEAGDE